MSKYSKKYQISDDLVLGGAFWPTFNKVANVLIVTGMEEHALRYTDFALALNSSGFEVFCLDYYGQGENVTSLAKPLGIVPDHGFELFVDSLAKVVDKVKIDGLPIYVIGHSMGSFISQRLVQKYPRLVDKLVIVGSNGPSPLYGIGKLVASLTVNKNNRDEKAKFLASLSIGSYNKTVKEAKTSVDWLSYNEKNVAAYLASPLDGIPSSKGFYLELLRGTGNLYKKKHYKFVDRALPLLIISGQDDPVGNFGKGVIKLSNFYKKLGFTSIDVKIYPNMRHEILNENNKEIVYELIKLFLGR